MARLKEEKAKSGKRILIIDDQKDYLMTTAALLEHEGHEVLTAINGNEGLELLKKGDIDLLLLDYYMPGNMTGEEVVKELRKFDPITQVVLQTGYAGDYPPREMLKRLDIQGYHDKSDGPMKMLMWVDIGLKVANTVRLLNKSRLGLNYILDITPDMHKIQPLEDLLQGILYQISGLLGVVNSFVAVIPDVNSYDSGLQKSDAFIAMMEEEARLIVRAATGRFMNQTSLSEYVETFSPSLNLKNVYEVIRKKQVEINDDSTMVPLIVGDIVLGIIYLDQIIFNEQDINLIKIFANQAAVAIQNSRLYEMATLDPLTGVYVRRIFNQWFQHELRTAFRSKNRIALLIIDMDGLKTINDSAGHLTGDQALSALGKVLRQATRATDFVCRYGGDEFVVILSPSAIDGIETVSGRIFKLLNNTKVDGTAGEISLKVSIGGINTGEINFEEGDIPRPIPEEYFREMGRLLIKNADENLYKIKKKGGNGMLINTVIEWPEFEKTQKNPAK